MKNFSSKSFFSSDSSLFTFCAVDISTEKNVCLRIPHTKIRVLACCFILDTRFALPVHNLNVSVRIRCTESERTSALHCDHLISAMKETQMLLEKEKLVEK